jgi:GTP1/Obg family GTP-binding protein
MIQSRTGNLIRGKNMAILGLIPEAKAAMQLLQLAHKQGWLDKLITAFRKKHKILVLGSTGVGKTNFLHSLSTLMPEAIHYMSRTEFVQKHQIKIAKELFQFQDTPGEIGKATRRLKAVREAMATPIAGVINLVAFGYHEQRNVDQSIFTKDMQPTAVYLAQQRKIECLALREWAELLADQSSIGWMMTVVTKADLWWHKKDEVLKYYGADSEYTQSLGSLQQFSPPVLPYSSVFHKFYDRTPLSGSFDDKDRQREREHLLKTLLSSVGKGGLHG